MIKYIREFLLTSNSQQLQKYILNFCKKNNCTIIETNNIDRNIKICFIDNNSISTKQYNKFLRSIRDKQKFIPNYYRNETLLDTIYPMYVFKQDSYYESDLEEDLILFLRRPPRREGSIPNYLPTYEKIENDLTIFLHYIVHIYYEDLFIKKLTYDFMNIMCGGLLDEEKDKMTKFYKNIYFCSNSIILSDVFNTEYFIYGENPALNILPNDCKTEIYELKFITNSDNQLLDVIAKTRNFDHPNINKRDGKVCLGFLRHKTLDFKLMKSVVDNIKIVNLLNCYNVPKQLKEYISKQKQSNLTDLIFFN